MRSSARLLALVAAATLLPMVGAQAANPVLDDKFSFRLGGIYNNIEGTATVARPPLPITPIDLDDMLGIDTEHTKPKEGNPALVLGVYDDTYKKVDGKWLFNSRHYNVMYQGAADYSAELTPYRPD